MVILILKKKLGAKNAPQRNTAPGAVEDKTEQGGPPGGNPLGRVGVGGGLARHNNLGRKFW